MNKPELNDPCSDACLQCPISKVCSDSGPQQNPTLKGRSLGLAAAACFLLPLVLGFVGAVAGGFHQTGQLLGGTIGLGAGMAVVALATRMRQRQNEDRA